MKRYLYLLSAGHLCTDLSGGALPALLPFLVLYYDLDYAAVGGLMFASSFLSSVIQPIFGYLADKLSQSWFLVAGVFLSGACFALTGFVSDYWAIFTVVALMGVGGSMFHPEAARLVHAVSGRNEGKAMGIFSVGGNGGFGIGPLLVVGAVISFGMPGMVVFAVIAVMMSLLLIRALPSLRRAVQDVSPATQSRETVRDGAIAGKNDWRQFSKLTIVIIFRAIAVSSLFSFLPLFCIHILGASEAAGSLVLSVLSLSGIVMTLWGGSLADRYGCVWTLRLCCILFVPLMIFITISTQIWIVYALLLPLSFCVSGAYSAYVVLGQRYLARSIGFASGVTMGLAFSIGGMLVPVLGWVADMYGLLAAMEVITACTIGAAACSFVLPEPAKNVTF
jgi:FSR family fosmidomycin resistance protein-like MFS transporter